jgi:hypothetical protein
VVYRMLRKHFRGDACYVRLLELFLDVSHKTELGQVRMGARHAGGGGGGQGGGRARGGRGPGRILLLPHPLHFCPTCLLPCCLRLCPPYSPPLFYT